MSTNNDVFKVLVGKTVEDGLGNTLSNIVDAGDVAHLGVFDYDKATSLNSSTAAKNIFLATTLDKDGDNVADSIEKSAGQYIQVKNVRGYTVRPHTAARPLIVKVGGYEANCETEYGIRLSFSNEEIFKRQGYNQLTVPYTYVTGACDDCGTICPTGDANEVTLGLAKNINNDPLGLVKATMVAREALTKATIDAATGGAFSGNIAAGDEILEADVELLIAFNKTLSDGDSYLYTDVVIETIPVKVNKYCSVNLRYYKPRQTNVEVSGIAGFEGVITPEVLQELAYEEGSGYDLKQKEFESQSMGGSPYVLSEATGTARYLEYTVDVNEKYDVVALTYDSYNTEAWHGSLSNQTTWIAFPTSEKVELRKFLAILDNLLSPLGFDELADDFASAGTAGTAVEPTEDETADTDGLA